MGSNSSLPELLHNLDATTYFFVTSGLFIGIVGLVFFILGLWFGGLLWRGYKRRYRAAEATIESLKTEAAQLKRRIAGQSPRTQGSASTHGLSEPEFAPLEEAVLEEPPLEDESSPWPPRQPFTLWTLPGGDEGEPAPLPASRAFTVWTEPRAPKAVRIAEVLSNTPAELPAPAVAGFTAPLLFPTPSESQPQLIDFPPSQAFSLWTEEGWEPAPAPAPPAPTYFAPSTAFTLWMAEDFRPAHVRLSWPPSTAFTLWTHEDFVPVSPQTLPPPAPAALPVLPVSRDALIAATATAVRSVASHPRPAERRVIVTFPDERPASPRSHAFTLWTQPSDHSTPGGTGISQRSALASLIRNRMDASPLPPLPLLDMEPLPFVPVPEKDAQGA
jgi:hypothetical protein